MASSQRGDKSDGGDICLLVRVGAAKCVWRCSLGDCGATTKLRIPFRLSIWMSVLLGFFLESARDAIF